ncbi:MAG: dockerin type I domain-containing protein, partial [Candidatus Daviesbacteria bacterium]|nr:dockerin type I domain-containing protein [Candidatus Daviesbacteria bacterium]
PPSPPPSPPPVVTKEFRIAESPTDLNSAQWQPYNSVPMKYDNFEFKDKKPGVKTIFVQFKDSNDKVSCGGNNTYCTTQIRLLGDDPAITSCSLGFEGNNTILNLQGKNFGSTKGIIKSGEAVLQVKGSWRDDSVQAILPNAQPGQNIPVTLTNTDGQTGEIPCSSVSQLSLGAKLFCRQPALHQTDNVDLTMVEAFAGGKKFNQKVTIDKDGIVQGLTQKLESGKDYVLSIKAPRSLRKNAPFKAGEGVTKIPNFTLWVGDIFPTDGGDGLINSLDKQQLNREWNITSDVKGRSGDFNQDGRVNSIDWACMRVSMVDSAGRGDDPEPVPGAQAAPAPSLSPKGQTCGGLQGIKCADGYKCQLESNDPDAMGSCVPLPSPSASPAI